MSAEKLSSAEPLANSVGEVWDKLQSIKSVANAIHFQAETTYSFLESQFGAKQANSLIGCLNLIVVMAEEAQEIIESKVESGLG